jgi:hypothetical protein
VHESEKNRIQREIRRLTWATTDMKLVVEAVDEFEWGGSRVLEAGIFVTYARPFKTSGRPALPEELAPLSEDEVLHEELIRRRDTVYAHSDEGGARKVVDPFGEHSYADAYEPLGAAKFAAIRDLAQRQRERFETALQLRVEKLRAAGVPADPTI